ncbi:hypothetical protein JMJ35_001948 [Cladonia borealis]|uniref:Alpha-1,2-mannosyltransferase n=1 Tax=Cladonia borealis TaxID=184061 RepID=A0AA39R904_9LECA|nr:hypothetical protein JMJ35_001948 [Cladonia borealis]
MFLRPARSITFIIAVVALFFSVSILESRLKKVSRNKLSIITAPTHEASPPPPRIVEFWGKWAKVFDKAKPNIGPITITSPASVAGSDKALGDREPSPFSIGISEDDVKSLQQSHNKLVNHPGFNTTNQEVPSLFSGTGIVTVAGGQYFPPALVGIRMLRKTGSTLPVHVFLKSKSEYEPEICEEILPALNAECFVIEDHLRKDAPFKVDHFQLKVLAILFSTFETVLYMDSDCMALRDPAELIETEPFLSRGFLSWGDYWVATEDPVFYKIAGLKDFPKHLPARSSESGQMVISKKKHLDSLLLTAYYNVFGPKYYYPLLSQGAMGQGDKETFLAGAVVLGKPYYRVREKVGTIGYFDSNKQFHGGAMVQWHAADEYASQNATEKKKPRPFFLHANVPKMNVAHMLDENAIYQPDTQKRVRVWGKEESVRSMFGFDVEKMVWNEMREMACQLKDTLKDFKGRQNICKRAQEHYREVFEVKTGGGVKKREKRVF